VRAARPVCCDPNRKNSLFAGHDQGAANWACLASLIETAKLHGPDPRAYLADILTKLVNGWPVQKLDELLPCAWPEQIGASLAA
jgi:transposase